MLGGRDQAGAVACGDNVGRDKFTRNETHIDLSRSGAASKIEALKARLLEEMQSDSTATELIEGLQQYHVRRKPSDGVEGLRGWKANCKRLIAIVKFLDALEQKELFAKLLAKRSLYASAQEIFVDLLSLAVHEFRMSIQPLLSELDGVGYNELVTAKIVRPLIDEGDCVLSTDAVVTMGLYYWLAEQCRF